MTTFDATQDFQATTNPNGVWSYGYSEAGGAGYAFIPFDKSQPAPRPGWTRANYNTSGTPTAWRNLEATTMYGIGVGQLCLHPGPRANGDYAILRFTAPKSGTYRISGQFFAGDLGSMNARIMLRGRFDMPLQVFISTTDNAVINVPPQTLNAGDTVDFLIGNNGSYGWGSTPLQVRVSDAVVGNGVGLVLSGGGARGDFQLGAIRYLYEKGRVPSIICGTSVGAINAIKLAEGENPVNPKQGLPGLLTLWQSLKTNDDMFLPEPWLFDADMDPTLSLSLRTGASLEFGGPGSISSAWGDVAPVVNWFLGLIYLGDGGQKLLKSAQVIMTKARGLFNLSPIQRRLETDCDPALIRAWADRGNQLRMALVSLDSGKLRYVTERGLLIERNGAAVVDPTAVAPACSNVAGEVRTMQTQADQLQAQIRDLQAQLSTAATGAKAALVAQIRSLGTQLAGVATQISVKRGQLAECMALNPRDFVLPDMRVGAMASSSIPGVFLPTKVGTEYYVDAGIREVAPVQSAIDLGATKVFVVHASSRTLAPYVTPAQGGILSIVTRSLTDIVLDEVDNGDRLLISNSDAAAASVTHIEPLVDIHSIQTIDPGLIQISHDYGYMRAADTLDGATGRRDSLATDITLLRVSIWSMENAAAGKSDPMHLDRPAPIVPDVSLVPVIAAKKADLKKLIDERLNNRWPVPDGMSKWALQPELHPWAAELVNDAQFIRQAVPPSIPSGATAPVTVTMRNSGTTTWQTAKGYALGAQNPHDNTTWGTRRWALPKEVAPNSIVTFTMQMPAPPAAGANFQWRMVQENVGWFGAVTASARVVVGPAAEPPVCADLRQQMVQITQQIVELKDMLTGNPRNDAVIQRQIANLTSSLNTLRANAQASGCALP